jgi:hypothetical protein
MFSALFKFFSFHPLVCETVGTRNTREQRIAAEVSVFIVISGFCIDARDYQAGRPRLTVGPNSPQTSIQIGW